MTFDEAGLLAAIRRASPEGKASATAIRRFLRTIDESGSLQSFFERLLPQLVAVFQGNSGQIWLKAQGAAGACFAIRYRMDELDAKFASGEQHERLVELAWQQRLPMLVEPQPRRGAASAPSPDGAILFSPIVHLNQPLALIELLLPASEGPIAVEARKAYLQAAQWIANAIHHGLRKRMPLATGTLDQAKAQLQQLDSEIQTYRQAILRSIETRLRQFQGWTFASFEANQAFTKMIHDVLEAHGLRVRCPECSAPAILRCLKSGNSKHGIFVYDHYLDDGRTFHGGPSAFPLLSIVAKPARRQPSQRKSSRAKRNSA